MRSTCPNCLSQIEHAHSDTRVLCTSCNESFSPFLTGAASDSSSQEPLIPVEMGLNDFSESTLAFKDIIQFGEQMNEGAPSTEPLATPQRKQKGESTPSQPLPHQSPSVKFSSDDFVMTTGDLASHFIITHWFAPCSQMVNLGNDEAPLETALARMKESAIALGANAITGVRCSLAPDNKRALLLGTPVRCEKRA